MQTLVKSIVFAAVLGISSLALAAAAPDAYLGTWTLNMAKSKFAAGHEIKSQTRTYTETPDGVSLKVTGVGSDGATIAQQSIFKYDGKSYPVSGAAEFDALSLRRVNGSTVTATMMKAGVPVGTTVRSVSMHGKLLTLSSKIKGADGKRYQSTSVFDKQ